MFLCGSNLALPLIQPQFNSYFFLLAIYLDIALNTRIHSMSLLVLTISFAANSLHRNTQIDISS